MIREPVVAGSFYPGKPSSLEAEIKGFTDEKAPKKDVIGLVSPHAGYMYSGAVAGATISRIKFKGTFIILGPSHTGRGKPFSIMTEGSWRTPFGEVEIDSTLGKAILARSRHLEEDAVAHLYEHSIEVQLPFLQYFKRDIKIVPIVLSLAPPFLYTEIGEEIADVIMKSRTKPVIIASSDMTHYEPQESAKKKDTEAINAILNLDEDELMRLVIERNLTMCGYAPTAVLIAAAKKLGTKGAELVDYKTSGDVTKDYSSVVGYAGILILKGRAKKAKPKKIHPLPNLAKETVESYVKDGKLPRPKALTSTMKKRAGVFVTIKKHGELRGCIGTIEPTQPNVAEEIIRNAVSSSTRDPRFPPVTAKELPDLTYSVDVLTKPKPVSSEEQLDPKRYGVIVEIGQRRGLLLPNLEGVDTIEQQISICRQKAGIAPEEPVKLYRFEVKRYN